MDSKRNEIVQQKQTCWLQPVFLHSNADPPFLPLDSLPFFSLCVSPLSLPFTPITLTLSGLHSSGADLCTLSMGQLAEWI